MIQPSEPVDTPRLRERAPRTVTVLMNAAIQQGGRDGLCRIRNLSDGGMTIETSLPLVVDRPAEVIVHTGAVVPGHVRWAKDGRAGLSCASSPVAIVRQACHAPHGPALPRFTRAIGIDIAVQGIPYRCTMDSLSIRDVLATEVPVALHSGQFVSIGIEGLGALPASLQIAEDGEVFARFAPALGYATLDAWLALRPEQDVGQG